MKRIVKPIIAVVLSAGCAAAAASAQSADAPSASASAAATSGTAAFVPAAQRQWQGVRDFVAKAAEQVPEADYAFQPTPKVRTLGQLFAHIADAQSGMCGRAADDKAARFGDSEKTKTSKADIVAAVKASNAACDAAFAKMNEQTAFQLLEGAKTPTPRISVLTGNTAHTWEHYGNIVTYMRMKDMVPPSSQGGGM